MSRPFLRRCGGLRDRARWARRRRREFPGAARSRMRIRSRAGRMIGSGASASAPRPSCRRSGRSRTSMKRPCGVSHTALCEEARRACVVRKKVRAPPRTPVDAEKAEVFEEAVALEHRRIDRPEGGAFREEFAREQQADERVPPRGVIENRRRVGARDRAAAGRFSKCETRGNPGARSGGSRRRRLSSPRSRRAAGPRRFPRATIFIRRCPVRAADVAPTAVAVERVGGDPAGHEHHRHAGAGMRRAAGEVKAAQVGAAIAGLEGAEEFAVAGEAVDRAVRARGSGRGCPAA